MAACQSRKAAVAEQQPTVTEHVCDEQKAGDAIELKTSPRASSVSVVRGVVVMKETQEFFSFQHVKLVSANGEERNVLSDENGRFSLDSLKLGKYTLRIETVGFEPASAEIELLTPSVVEVKVQLKEMFYPIVEKPVIYLYPTAPCSVQVQLRYDGELRTTYPHYTTEGWRVYALPTGDLTDEAGKEYYALFWEGEPRSAIRPRDGFLVKGSETVSFLEEKLAALGSNRREANEFIMYWLPRLEGNAYNLIHFAGIEYEEMAELVVMPKPETLIRVMMLYQPLTHPATIAPQDVRSLYKTRQGFTAVEWGGSEARFEVGE